MQYCALGHVIDTFLQHFYKLLYKLRLQRFEKGFDLHVHVHARAHTCQSRCMCICSDVPLALVVGDTVLTVVTAVCPDRTGDQGLRLGETVGETRGRGRRGRSFLNWLVLIAGDTSGREGGAAERRGLLRSL